MAEFYINSTGKKKDDWIAGVRYNSNGKTITRCLGKNHEWQFDTEESKTTQYKSHGFWASDLVKPTFTKTTNQVGTGQYTYDWSIANPSFLTGGGKGWSTFGKYGFEKRNWSYSGNTQGLAIFQGNLLVQKGEEKYTSTRNYIIRNEPVDPTPTEPKPTGDPSIYRCGDYTIVLKKFVPGDPSRYWLPYPAAFARIDQLEKENFDREESANFAAGYTERIKAEEYYLRYYGEEFHPLESIFRLGAVAAVIYEKGEDINDGQAKKVLGNVDGTLTLSDSQYFLYYREGDSPYNARYLLGYSTSNFAPGSITFKCPTPPPPPEPEPLPPPDNSPVDKDYSDKVLTGYSVVYALNSYDLVERNNDGDVINETTGAESGLGVFGYDPNTGEVTPPDGYQGSYLFPLVYVCAKPDPRFPDRHYFPSSKTLVLVVRDFPLGQEIPTTVTPKPADGVYDGVFQAPPTEIFRRPIYSEYNPSSDKPPTNAEVKGEGSDKIQVNGTVYLTSTKLANYSYSNITEYKITDFTGFKQSSKSVKLTFTKSLLCGKDESAFIAVEINKEENGTTTDEPSTYKASGQYYFYSGEARSEVNTSGTFLAISNSQLDIDKNTVALSIPLNLLIPTKYYTGSDGSGRATYSNNPFFINLVGTKVKVGLETEGKYWIASGAIASYIGTDLSSSQENYLISQTSISVSSVEQVKYSAFASKLGTIWCDNGSILNLVLFAQNRRGYIDSFTIEALPLDWTNKQINLVGNKIYISKKLSESDRQNLVEIWEFAANGDAFGGTRRSDHRLVFSRVGNEQGDVYPVKKNSQVYSVSYFSSFKEGLKK